MALEGVSELRDWLFLLLLCLTLLAEVLEFAAAMAVARGFGSDSEVPCPSACRCDEDFIYCNDRGLTAIPPLPLTATILYLQNNHIDNAGLPTSLENHLNVQVVYLYDNELDDFPMHLPPSLRELHLQDNNIRTLPRSALARLPLLEKLHLDDNSISTVSIEDQAFADNPRLRLLFLSRNHLSSIPSGLPASLEELRLDDNRISTIPTHAFRGLSSLRRLVLDGNLLANQRIADDTFSRLSNLTELSLVRNSLQTPPFSLPSVHLQRLNLQDNALIHMPRGSLDGMRRLQRLDLSGNNLTTLPRGLFRDMDSLSQLLARGNPWHCGCNLRWLHDWLHTRGSSVTVRGFTCQSPERVRGLALRDLNSQMEECEGGPAGAGPVGVGGQDMGNGGKAVATSTTLSPPQGSLFTLRSKRPGLRLPDADLDYSLGSSPNNKTLVLNVKPLSPHSIHLTWHIPQPSASFRLSWLRLGNSAATGSITETLVPGDRREYLLSALQPQSSYIICMAPLPADSKSAVMEGTGDSGGAPVCARAETSDLTQPSSEKGENRVPEQLSVLSLAGIIGGATALVFLAFIFAVVCWCGHRTRHISDREHSTRSSYRSNKRYDDYVESGTKKDNSILEITGPGFQMTPMVAQQPLHTKALREDYIIHTIFPSNGTALYKSTQNTNNTVFGTNRGHREGGIPDIDYSYTVNSLTV
ncbi:hypothetical protein Z043-107113 [Arapaima gigas]